MRSLFTVFCLLPLLFLTTFASAKSAKNVPPPPETKNLVTAVNAATGEVTIRYKNGTYGVDKNAKVYTIDDLTTITINNVPGKFAEIRPGMEVLGSTERDDHTLDNITLGGSAAIAAPAPKPAAKPKPKPVTTT